MSLVHKTFSYKPNNTIITVTAVNVNGTLWVISNPFKEILKIHYNVYKYLNKNNQMKYMKIKEYIFEDKNIDLTTVLLNEDGLNELMTKSNKLDIVQWISDEIMPQLKSIDSSVWILDDLKMMAGYVYIATNADYAAKSIYKIGVTWDLDSKLAQLNDASVEDYWYVNVIWSFDAKNLKRNFLKMFAEKNVKRNFFKLTKQDLLLCKIIK